MLPVGPRPLSRYRSLLPLRRYASSAIWPGSPFQNLRTLSRYLPFHSLHSTGQIADLVAEVADVPRLGDQLDARKDRVLVDDVEERRARVVRLRLAGQR